MVESPFPEPVLVSLAKQILLDLSTGTVSSLFTKDFQFSSPLLGPLSRDEFISEAFPLNLAKSKHVVFL